MEKALKMIKEAQLLKSAETDKGDSASLSSVKLSRLEYEILQMKKQMEDTLGKMSNLNESLELYKEDLSAANKTINDLREENRALREENALLKREKFATTSQNNHLSASRRILSATTRSLLYTLTPITFTSVLTETNH